MWFVNVRHADKSLFSAMDLTRDFYFSYSYDLTNTLQANMAHARAAGTSGSRPEGVDAAPPPAGAPPPPRRPRPFAAAVASLPPRDKFVWNHHLAYGLFRCVSTPQVGALPDFLPSNSPA